MKWIRLTLNNIKDLPTDGTLFFVCDDQATARWGLAKESIYWDICYHVNDDEGRGPRFISHFDDHMFLKDEDGCHNLVDVEYEAILNCYTHYCLMEEPK